MKSKSRKPDWRGGLYILILGFVALLLIISVSRHQRIYNYYNTTNQASVQAILYVSSLNGSDHGTGSNTMPYKTIIEAVKAAPHTSVIIVEAGTYRGEVDINKTIILLGQSPASTIINATGSDYGILIQGEATNGSVVGGFTIEGADDQGVFVQNTYNITIGYSQVQDNEIKPPNGIAQDKGIQLVGVSNSLVEDNVVVDNPGGGIGVADDGAVNPGTVEQTGGYYPSQGNRILKNYISQNSGSGIGIASYNQQGTMNNVVANNTISQNSAGIVVSAYLPDSMAMFTTIYNNFITYNFLPGIIVYGNTSGDMIGNTTIYHNLLSKNGAEPYDPSINDTNTTAIIISNPVMPIYNTTVVNNTVNNEYYGVWLKNPINSTEINGNMFTNVTVPFYRK